MTYRRFVAAGVGVPGLLLDQMSAIELSLIRISRTSRVKVDQF
jgi:hypothetical protein